MYDSGPDKVLLESSDYFLHLLLYKLSQSSLASCSRVVCTILVVTLHRLKRHNL